MGLDISRNDPTLVPRPYREKIRARFARDAWPHVFSFACYGPDVHEHVYDSIKCNGLYMLCTAVLPLASTSSMSGGVAGLPLSMLMIHDDVGED